MVQEQELVPEVTRHGIFDCQVCVPSTYTDKEATAFANEAYPCGTSAGWQIRKEGSEYLAGDPERVNCESRSGFVHIMMDC